MLDLAAMPYADHALKGRPSNVTLGLINPREDEQRLASLVAAVNRMLDRCEKTMLHTSRNFLCWLRSRGKRREKRMQQQMIAAEYRKGRARKGKIGKTRSLDRPIQEAY